MFARPSPASSAKSKLTRSTREKPAKKKSAKKVPQRDGLAKYARETAKRFI
jgi:hypothetical protein